MKVKDYPGPALADMNIHRHNCDFTDDERDMYQNETEGLGFDFSDPEKMKADEKRVARDADQAESQSTTEKMEKTPPTRSLRIVAISRMHTTIACL